MKEDNITEVKYGVLIILAMQNGLEPKMKEIPAGSSLI